MARARGFTLIELMVVIAIIGMLASVILASLSAAKAKGQKAAALEAGHSITNAIVSCWSTGGDIVVPNSATAPTNALCSTGSSDTWPKPPQGWQWYTTQVWTSNSTGEELVYLTSTYNSDAMYCGEEPSWTSSCDSANPGYCRASRSFSCAYYNSSTGDYE